MEHRQSQKGVALVLVLILLGVGALVMGPSLRNTATALNFFAVSRESTDVAYALDAVTQQALWLLESADPFEDCVAPLDGADDSFVECVVEYGSWELATTDYIDAGKDNESEVDSVNRQQVEVIVKVPGELIAQVEPTPTPTATNQACFYAWVSRDPTWVQVDEPIDYTLHIWNCSSSPSQKSLRHVAVITSVQMIYEAGSAGGSLVSPPDEPDVGNCQAPVQSTELALCPGYPANSLLLSWPTAATPYGDEAGTQPVVQMAGGEPYPEKTLAFQLRPDSWGIFYIDILFCYFSEDNPCEPGRSQNTGKVAPIVSGMFNINGTGKGNAFGASAKLHDGADLISEQPQ